MHAFLKSQNLIDMKKLGYLLLILFGTTFLSSCYDEADEVLEIDHTSIPNYNGEDDDSDPIPPPPPPPPSVGG